MDPTSFFQAETLPEAFESSPRRTIPIGSPGQAYVERRCGIVKDVFNRILVEGVSLFWSDNDIDFSGFGAHLPVPSSFQGSDQGF